MMALKARIIEMLKITQMIVKQDNRLSGDQQEALRCLIQARLEELSKDCPDELSLEVETELSEAIVMAFLIGLNEGGKNA